MADHVAATLARQAEAIATGTRITAILFPLRLEARPFLERVGTAENAACGKLVAWRATSQGTDLLIVRTGVGRRRTLAALDALSGRMPIDTVVSAGFAGALAAELKVGDVIAATHVVDENLASIQATWIPPGVRQGRLLTMSRVIGDPAEKSRLHARHQACAVDMESLFIGQWCAERGIRFSVVRAITDDAETSITAAVARLVSNERWSIMSGLLGMVKAPLRSIPELWRLRRNALVAGERLADVLCQVLEGISS